MQRNGKIARLPREIRQQLNHRLQDGEEGGKLAAWLNGLPRVRKVLEEKFGGRPINEVNLTEWRQGGFLEWQRHEEARELVEGLAERAGDLEADADGTPIADRLSSIFAVELALFVEAVRRETAEPKERWERLRGTLRELTQLRREDHRAARVAIEQERRQAEADRQQEEQRERDRAEEKKRTLAPIYAIGAIHTRAIEFGGGQEGKRMAAYVLEVERDLPPGTLTRHFDSPPKEAEKPKAAEPPPAPTTRVKAKPGKAAKEHSGKQPARRVKPVRQAQASNEQTAGQPDAAVTATGPEVPPADVAAGPEAPAVEVAPNRPGSEPESDIIKPN
jgi:hypothetical protein